MRKLVLNTVVGLFVLSTLAHGATRKVPGTYSSIEAAIDAANDGDTILISDGTYKEGSIRIEKSLIIASKFLTDGNESHISNTIIDAGGSSDVFKTREDAGLVEFVGLTLTGREKLIIGNSEIDVHDCRFIGGADQVSFERESFGRVTNCFFEGSRDDAIDSDSSTKVSNAFIEMSDNIITNCGDDGIEIRLYSRSSGAIMPYTIANNIIINSDEDGIQLIDERASRNDNSRVFYIINNLIKDSGDAGIGCMPEQDTIEDFGGAPGMDEPVYVINNTIVENHYGITGGDNMVVLNSIIKDNPGTGIKRVKDQGIVDYTVFHNNGTHISNSAEGGNNFKNKNPEYDSNTYELLAGSFSIDKGADFYRHNGIEVLDLPSSAYDGSAPDLGAFESDSDGSVSDDISSDDTDSEVTSSDDTNSEVTNKAPVVDAGPDRILFSRVDNLAINGTVSDDGLPNGRLTKIWNKVSGPGTVSFSPRSSEDTTATFSSMGIYELKLTADDSQLESSDSVVVRYIKDGDGVRYTLDGDLFIDAEKYSYLYGTAAVVNDSSADGGKAIQALEGQGNHAFADYSVITTDQESDIFIWLRMKGPNTAGNSLFVEFNGSSTTNDVETVAGDNIYRWRQIDGSFHTEAGIWNLRVKAKEDGVFWDTIAVSADPDFSPVPLGESLSDSEPPAIQQPSPEDDANSDDGDVIIFKVAADATIKKAHPNENFGDLREFGTDNRPVQHFLMKFDISGIGRREVTSAKLRLLCIDKSDKGGDFYKTDNDWSENKVTWANAPRPGTKRVASLGPVVRGKWAEVDLSTVITGNGTYSFRVKSSSTDGADYRSREKDFKQPQLILTVK